MRAELEVAKFLSDHLGIEIRRRYNLGTHEDTGDIAMPRNGEIPPMVIQVVDWKDVTAAVRAKPAEAERQRLEYQRLTGDDPLVATFVRLRGGDYRVVLTPEQWATYWREAQ